VRTIYKINPHRPGARPSGRRVTGRADDAREASIQFSTAAQVGPKPPRKRFFGQTGLLLIRGRLPTMLGGRAALGAPATTNYSRISTANSILAR